MLTGGFIMKRFASTLLATACVIGLALPTLTSAQSTGRLYDPMPPDDSAYLRIVQAGSGKPVDVLVDGKVRLRQLASRNPSAYLVIPAGKHVIQLQSGSTKGPKTTVNAASKGAYTLAFPASTGTAEGTVFVDRTSTNRLKSMLAVYHLAPATGSVDVTTADGKTTVFDDIKPGSPAILEVNPIKVQLAVTSQAKATASSSLSMTQGSAYSVFLFPSKGKGISPLTVENQRERYTGK